MIRLSWEWIIYWEGGMVEEEFGVNLVTWLGRKMLE